MRKAIVFSALIAICISCNDAAKTNDDPKKDDAATAANVTLPYTTKETPDWEMGSSENVAIAMKTLKGYETNDMDGIRQYFADSVEFRADYWHFKGTADSLISALKDYRKSYSSFSIRMDDYESVKSKSRGDEYVSLWYQENFTDSKGKTDSIFEMDDIKLKNGKIVSIDAKVRHFPSAKPM